MLSAIKTMHSGWLEHIVNCIVQLAIGDSNEFSPQFTPSKRLIFKTCLSLATHNWKLIPYYLQFRYSNRIFGWRQYNAYYYTKNWGFRLSRRLILKIDNLIKCHSWICFLIMAQDSKRNERKEDKRTERKYAHFQNENGKCNGEATMIWIVNEIRCEWKKVRN